MLRVVQRWFRIAYDNKNSNNNIDNGNYYNDIDNNDNNYYDHANNNNIRTSKGSNDNIKSDIKVMLYLLIIIVGIIMAIRINLIIIIGK